MKPDLVDVVVPIVSAVCWQLAPDSKLDPVKDLVDVQADLRSLVNATTPVNNRQYKPDGDILDLNSGVHWLMTCWVDEVFSVHPDWGPVWVEKRLTKHFPQYRGNPDLENGRGWRVPLVAREALLDGRFEVVELCLMLFGLGFKGTWDDDGKRDEWLKDARSGLKRHQRARAARTARLSEFEPPGAGPEPPRTPGDDTLAHLAARFAAGWLVCGLVLAGAAVAREVLATPAVTPTPAGATKTEPSTGSVPGRSAGDAAGGERAR